MRPENVAELLEKRRALATAQEAVSVASLALQEVVDRDTSIPESETRTDLQRFDDLRDKISHLADFLGIEMEGWSNGITRTRVVSVEIGGGRSVDYAIFFELSRQQGNFSAIVAKWIRRGRPENEQDQWDIVERVSNNYRAGNMSDGPTYELMGNSIGSLEATFEAYMASDIILEKTKSN